jgi:hypothetical protein
MKSLFKSDIEEKLFYWLENRAAQLEDGETGMRKCVELLCERMDLPDEVSDWVIDIGTTLAALEAGIPLSVIQRKTKLSDHFSPEYIESQKGKR